jgi:hypothetical protein
LSGFYESPGPLHQAMRAVLHRHTAIAIEIASSGGTFVCCRRHFCLIKT